MKHISHPQGLYSTVVFFDFRAKLLLFEAVQKRRNGIHFILRI
jgi:hypothetical protein